MDWLEAVILGLLQGLTEFLPVSSSGHLELGKAILGTDIKENMSFTVVVHGATVLSTIVVFRKDLLTLIRGLFQFRWNEETRYIAKILLSMIPVGIVGVLLKDEVKSFFSGENLTLVGLMLVVTAAFLSFTYFFKDRDKTVSFASAFIIGIAQAVAVLPGISRSGATIATGLILGNKRELVAKFSFLMVLIPIIGENLLDISSGEFTAEAGPGIAPLLIGFVVAFVTGLIACKWMIGIVKKGRLIYFAIYCFIVGIITVLISQGIISF
ncbi:MAG: undecaprenyl-diphosphate phosphatase [Bacteroidota bacterium]